MNSDMGYLMQRIGQSKQAADEAQHPAARKVHLTLVALYEEKLRALQVKPYKKAVPRRLPPPPLRPSNVPIALA